MCVPYQIKNNNNKATLSDSSVGQDLSKSFLPPQPLSFQIAIKLPASARSHSPSLLYAAKANSLGRRLSASSLFGSASPLHPDKPVISFPFGIQSCLLSFRLSTAADPDSIIQLTPLFPSRVFYSA